MNKKILVVIVILLLAFIGIGFLLVSRKSSPPTQITTLQNQKEPATGQSNSANKNESIQATLKSLLSMGKTKQCTFSNDTKAVSVNGTVYAGNGKVREDYQSKSAELNMSGHLIVDSTTMYMWTDTNNQGFKFALDQVPTAQPSSSSAKSQTPDVNKSMDFSCRDWSMNDSLFVLPANVTFQSFSVPAVVTSGEGSSAGGSTVCAACNNIPAGEARNTCLTQLHCQ